MAQRENDDSSQDLINHVRIREAAFDASRVAQLVVDRANVLVMVNEHARALFGMAVTDIGRPFQDLQISYRPVELRLAIDQVCAELKPAEIKDVKWHSPIGATYHLDVHIAPLFSNAGDLLGVGISFHDKTPYSRLDEELKHSRQELETALEELQSTVEELETTNEELQSTNEELETTNKELQATNEELETMNEELQSTNEELETINDELRQRTNDLDQVNAYLESIVSGIQSSVIVVDRDLKVHIWNRTTEDLWGLRFTEVQGEHLMNLDVGLPTDQLRQPIRRCLAGEDGSQEVTITAVNRRGRTIQCRAVCTPLLGPGEEIRGVILLMDQVHGQ